MKKTILVIMLMLSTAFVYGGAGTSGGLLLDTSTGARPAGRGEAFTAASDVYSIYYNPAGLAFIGGPQAGAMYLKGALDTSYEYAAGALPLGALGTAGFSFYAFQGGVIEVADALGNTTNKNSQSDILVTGAFAKQILLKGFSAGVSIKALFSTLVEDYRASAVTLDLGVLYKLDDLAIGASVANIIGELKYLDVGDKLPLIIRAGGEYSLKLDAENEAVVSADVVSSDKMRFNAGVEYCYQKQIFGRLGYRALQDAGGLTLGGGYKLVLSEGLAGSIDYAFVTGGGWNEAHKISMNIYFEDTKSTVGANPVKKNNRNKYYR